MHRDDLGERRQLSDEPALCSKCACELEDDPLVLFGSDNDDAWQYCRDCEGEILLGLIAAVHRGLKRRLI